jgi:hypothetical protein
MSIYLIVGCFAIGFAIGCPFGVGAAMWGMMDWQNGRRERIAAVAMQGLLTCFADNHKVAEMAVKQADALIERLDADGKGGQS